MRIEFIESETASLKPREKWHFTRFDDHIEYILIEWFRIAETETLFIIHIHFFHQHYAGSPMH